MVGEHDQGTPVSHAEFIHNQISCSELRIISNAAHMIGIEQAEIFNKTLVDFLKSQTR
jgi:pimeloyl-ACP methyl ester carboxylesterase